MDLLYLWAGLLEANIQLSEVKWSPHIETACSKARNSWVCYIIVLLRTQVLTPCYIYTKAWFDLILGLPPKFGTHTSRMLYRPIYSATD